MFEKPDASLLTVEGRSRDLILNPPASLQPMAKGGWVDRPAAGAEPTPAAELVVTLLRHRCD
jgi:hypothetical protein